MKQKLTTSHVVLSFAFIAIVICFSAFRQKDSTQQKRFRERYSGGSDDTTIRRKRSRPDIEFNLDQSDFHMMLLDEQMAVLDKQMKAFDHFKIQEKLNKELSNIDAEKIKLNVEEALAKVDFSKLNEEIQKSTRQEIKISMEEVKKEYERVKNDFKKQEFDFKIDAGKIQREVAEAIKKAAVDMKEAAVEMNKAKGEFLELKKLTRALQQDGLIDTKKGFTLEVRDGKLYLNGEKQPEAINERYSPFIKGKNYTINNEPGENNAEPI